MYEMRPATTNDWQPVSTMISLRELWLCERGLRSHGEGNAIRGLIGQNDETTKVMVLVEDDQILGCTVLISKPPLTGWTEAERAEPSLIMAMTHTHPAPAYRGDRLGWLMTLWVLDYAARLEDEVRWVRCTVADKRLMCHLRDNHGWQYVRSAHDPQRGIVHLLQHRSQAKPGLSALVASPESDHCATART